MQTFRALNNKISPKNPQMNESRGLYSEGVTMLNE